MKLLLDQNISYRLVNRISKDFPETTQITQLGLTDCTDREIWNYAREQGYTIVTFDADFYDLATFLGHPPKIIWLRTGNRTTITLANLLVDRKDVIKEFLTSEQFKDIACLEIE
ncbi:MAG: DUF5615 family PIN-like protein [Flavobacteriales bacterium]|nr:DUF5615 family PIN-like protein [Flavobacteriales bacterium]